MNILFWEFKEKCKASIKDIGYLLCNFFSVVWHLTYKLLRCILVITNVFFLIGLVLAIMNIMESVDGVSFFETQYINSMLLFCGCYPFMFFLCKLLRPKDL